MSGSAPSSRDLAGVREAAHAIVDACLGSGQQWNEAALEPVCRVLHAEIVAHHLMHRDPSGWQVTVVAYPSATENVADRVPGLLDNHPVIAHFQSHPEDLRTVRLSDFLSLRQVRQTQLYSDILKPMGTPRFAAIPAAVFTTSTGDGFGITRSGSDFTARERSLGDALQSLLSGLRHQTRQREQLARAYADSTGLTMRERDVLELLSHGRTAHSIGRALAISERTVHAHLQNVYRKLGTHDRLSTIRLVERRGSA